jgi:hypothetical protein
LCHVFALPSVGDCAPRHLLLCRWAERCLCCRTHTMRGPSESLLRLLIIHTLRVVYNWPIADVVSIMH